MLERLLAEIRAGGTLEVGALAERLDATPELVAAMLDHLERLGLLRPYEGCASVCEGCSLRGACAAGEVARMRLWRG